MTVNNAENSSGVTAYQPVAGADETPSGNPYLVGGYDLVADALRTWRLDADLGIVGVPVDRDIAHMLVEAGYDRARALQVTSSAVVAITVFEIDKRFEEKNIWEKLSE